MSRLAMVILWPSFLVAIVAEGFFFSWADPHDLVPTHHFEDLSPLAAYTIGFFCFWFFGSLASMLTYYLVKTSTDTHPLPASSTSGDQATRSPDDSPSTTPAS